MRPRQAATAARLIVVVALLALAPESASAEEPRVMIDAEGALLVPTAPTAVSAPGGTFSVAARFALAKWIAPLVRARVGVLGAAEGQRDPTGLGTLLLGVRFRPRGIAHPEEASYASCVWAEVDAGMTDLAGRLQPAFEAAVGFAFVAGEVDLGPAIRFLHVMPASPGDPTDTFFVTVGLELLFGDAR